jgi:hypothetical protein
MSRIDPARPDLAVSVEIGGTPEVAWEAVADPRRIASWSPETSGVSGADATPGPMPVGAPFSGSNRHGIFRWTTRCVVVESTRGESFAFDVSYFGLDVSRWRYAVTPVDGGTRVQEQWWDLRGGLMKLLGLVGTGVADRRTHNERTMRETLDALATDLGRTEP